MYGRGGIVMKMWTNEILKIRRSKSVKGLFLVFLVFIILSSFMGENKGGPLMNSGFAGPLSGTALWEPADFLPTGLSRRE